MQISNLVDLTGSLILVSHPGSAEFELSQNARISTSGSKSDIAFASPKFF